MNMYFHVLYKVLKISKQFTGFINKLYKIM